MYVCEFSGKGHFDTKLSKTNAVKYKTFRQTLQKNKISFEFSLRKKNTNWNKNYTLHKRVSPEVGMYKLCNKYKA